MRDIKFRGKAKFTEKGGVWKYGFVLNWATNTQIWENNKEGHNYIVDKKTIGQYTGFKDCEGTEIYEGDTLIDLDVELEEGTKLEDTQQQVYWCENHGEWKLDETFIQNKKNGANLSGNLNNFRFKVYSNIYENQKNNEKQI